MDKSLFFKKSPALPFIEMRLANQSSACYHTHSHDEFSFGVIDTGEAAYHNQQQQHHIGQGQTVTINPAEAHSCNPKAGKWSYRMLFIDTHWLGQLQQEMGITHGYDYAPFIHPYETSTQAFQNFDHLFQLLLDEKNSDMAEASLIEYFEQCFISPKENKVKPHTQSDTLQRAKSLIMDRLADNISLTEFTHETGLSRYHLIRSFKQTYGLSPHAFQLDQRIKKAKALLQQGKGLAETANTLGFADQSHFQRHFKKRIALTPKQYQAFFS